MNKEKGKLNSAVYLIVSILLIVVFFAVGVTDVLDPTNNKGYLKLNDGDMIENRHVNNYIKDKLKGIDTKDTIKATLEKEIDYIIVSDEKILEISDDGNDYKVKIEINNNFLTANLFIYAYFEKSDKNKNFEDFKEGDKISFKSSNLNKIGFSGNSLEYITFKDAEITIKEDN